MPSAPLSAPPSPADDRYAEACAAWRRCLENYLRLAREGAGGARLRAAAAADHAAALHRGRLRRDHDDGAG